MMNRRQFLTLASAAALSRGAGLKLEAQDGIHVSRLPYLQNVSDNRASIMWATAELGAGSVAYTSDGVHYQVIAARPRMFHPTETGMVSAYVQYQANLVNLQPNTEYTYFVAVDNMAVASGGDNRFRTAGPGPFKFTVLGDSGQATGPQGQIANLIAAERPAFVIHAGDLAYFRGTFEEFQRNYFNYYFSAMSTAAFFPCPGNHEYDTPGAVPYLSVHSAPVGNVPLMDRGRYYSFDWANVHIVSLDSMASLDAAVNGSGSMLRWLEADLRATRLFWRVVYFHHPPFATGPNQADPILGTVRDRIVPILERYGVQAVFNGHEHSYQRSQEIRGGAIARPGLGTIYWTTGGGGADLYPAPPSPRVVVARSQHHYLRGEVRGLQMKITGVRTDGTEIESVVVTPQPAFSDSSAPAVSFSPGLVRGASVRISGRNLSADETFGCTDPLPQRLGEAEVFINGQRISLLYVSPNLIYAQLPFAVEGSVTVGVKTTNGFAETSVSVP